MNFVRLQKKVGLFIQWGSTPSTEQVSLKMLFTVKQLKGLNENL
jgi:hypothetical protein